MPEDFTGGGGVAHVSQDAGAEEDAVEGGSVRGFGDEVCGRGVVEGEGFGGEGGLSGGFEVVC